jgi:hypothetical protein
MTPSRGSVSSTASGAGPSLVGTEVDTVRFDVEGGQVREFACATSAADLVHTDPREAQVRWHADVPATHMVVSGHYRDQRAFVAALGLDLRRIVVGSTAPTGAGWLTNWCGVESLLRYEVRFTVLLAIGAVVELSGVVTRVEELEDCSIPLPHASSSTSTAATSLRPWTATTAEKPTIMNITKPPGVSRTSRHCCRE